MKRRELFVGTGAALGLVSIPFAGYFANNESLRIGIMMQVFNMSGYDESDGLKNLHYYSKFKTAYKDLIDNKIDVLISSPQLLGTYNPEFNLLSFPMKNSAWHEAGLNAAQIFHEQNGISSQKLGTLSDLKLRLSSKSPAELSTSAGLLNPLSVAASGVDALAFERLGYSVYSSPFYRRLSAQLAELTLNIIDLTSSQSPAMILNGLHHMHVNLKINPTQQGNKTYIYQDNSSRGGNSIEMLFNSKVTSQNKLKSLKEGLASIIAKDAAYQQAALDAIKALPGYIDASSLPQHLLTTIEEHQNVYMLGLNSDNSFGLINYFKTLRGISS